VALTSANAQDAAAGATLAGLGTSSLSTLLDGASAASRRAVAPALPRTHVLMRFLRQQLDRVARNASGARVAAALSPPACGSGSATVNDNGAGTVTETFVACTPEAGVSLDGTITLTDAVADPGVSFSGTVSISLLLKQTGFADTTFTGNNIAVLETINVSVGTFKLTGQEILSSTAGVSERMGNFTLVASFDGTTETDDVAFNYSSSKIGGSIDVSTVTPCVTDSARNFPSTGGLSLTGSGGSKVQVTINGDETLATPQLKIELDADGDGTFETTLDRNWADLLV